MPKPCLIVSTCGTSLLMNGVENDLRSTLNDFANQKTIEEVPEPARQRLQQHLTDRRIAFIQSQDLPWMMKTSAELNGLLRYYNGPLTATRDHHILLATDTWLGESTARIVAGVLERHGHTVEVMRVSDLRTNDPTAFRWAMSELVAWCAQTVKGYRDAGHRIVFNLTGGFKSVQGFMQALGMLYADESIYVFESTPELLRLPRLPVQFDALTILRQHLWLFRRLVNQFPVNAADVRDLPESLVNLIDDQATLSPWGELIWQDAYRTIYSERLLEPLTVRLSYGPRFADSLTGLDALRLRLVNERLDQLARCLESPAYNPPSLDFKPLQGGARQGSTHECDAWADQDAKRLFGHFADGCFVVDRLDKALH